MVAVELVETHQAEGGKQGPQGGPGRVGGAEVLVVAVVRAVFREHAHLGTGLILMGELVMTWLRLLLSGMGLVLWLKPSGGPVSAPAHLASGFESVPAVSVESVVR